jgi:hypothetical protein
MNNVTGSLQRLQIPDGYRVVSVAMHLLNGAETRSLVHLNGHFAILAEIGFRAC